MAKQHQIVWTRQDPDAKDTRFARIVEVGVCDPNGRDEGTWDLNRVINGIERGTHEFFVASTMVVWSPVRVVTRKGRKHITTARNSLFNTNLESLPRHWG